MSIICNNISFKSTNLIDTDNSQESVIKSDLKTKLERSPEQDCIDFIKTQNKRPTLFSLLGKPIIESIDKKVKEAKQRKEIEAINKTCEKLIDNLTETQKIFQEVFMRKDLSEKETLEMIKRYHDIEIIGIKGDKETYIKELFKEAKSNYGIENLPNEIKIVYGNIRKNPKMLGYTDPFGDVQIRGDLSRKDIFNVVHHELRHVKQNYYAFNFNSEEFVKYSQPKNMEIPEEIFECAYDCKPDKSNIAPEYIEFAKKSLDAKKTYCSANKNENGYLAQWCEEDAFNTGNKMQKLFNL